MELLVLSDSHGRISRISEAYERQIKKPDAVVFLGDGIKDVSYCDFRESALFCVVGNCDMFTSIGRVSAENEIVMTLGGKRIMMTHGDAYGVKSTLARLIMAAVRNRADIVLFGHTHTPLALYLPEGESEYGIKLEKPLYLFNPGSVGGYDGSFGTVCIRDDGVILSHGRL